MRALTRVARAALAAALMAAIAAALGTGRAGAQPPAAPNAAAAAPGGEGLAAELEALARVDLLPRYRTNSRVLQVSSYDTTGGNDDGFSGRYSYVRREPGGLVLLDVRGPGVLHRIWTPTPTDDTVAFYFDGERAPRLRMRFGDLFSGDAFPFVRPLVGHEAGGFYSYLPVPFARSLKVVFEGQKVMFHQLQYRRYADGRGVRSLPADSAAWSPAERAALARAAARWSGGAAALGQAVAGAPADSSGAAPSGAGPSTAAPNVRCDARAVEIAPGDTAPVFRADRGGRVVALTVTPAAALAGPHRDVLLEARWDADSAPAVRAPLADLFGFAYGRPAMRGLLVGTRGDTSYSYLPMPFDRTALVRLVYQRRPDAAQAPLRATVRVCHTAERRDAGREGRLYAAWRRDTAVAAGEPYLILRARGRGHHVGTVLLAQGLNPGMTLFFEGDDVTEVDGERRLHGTGSEDYFNGGWYALLDRWDQAVSLPLHGALAYSLPMARTGGYRFYLADKVPFERDYQLTIEHGPERNAVPADYGSVAFYYGERPPDAVTAPTPRTTAVTVPTTHVFYPQLAATSVGWHTEAQFLINNRDLRVRSLTREPGLVRFALDEVPNGRYRVRLSYSEAPDGGEFSVWQRQRQVAPWRPSAAAAERRLVRQAVGEVELTDEARTLSIQTRGPEGRDAFRFDELVLERLP